MQGYQPHLMPRHHQEDQQDRDSDSDSSLFTLSTVLPREDRGIVSKTETPSKPSELQELRQENAVLKDTIDTFRDMLNIDKERSYNQDNHEEWMSRIRGIAK